MEWGTNCHLKGSTRGLRQGDPLSPYLFVLCLEKLYHIISSSVKKGDWKPFAITKDGPYLSHVFFADDLMLFGEASKKQLRVMLKCLDGFCKMSARDGWGLEKSKLYVSPDVKVSV